VTRPFPFARALASLTYGGPVAEALLRWKHGGNRFIAPLLAGGLVPLLCEARAHGTNLVCPVPLHPKRLRARGFNQALDLLRAARCQGRVPVRLLCDALERTTNTPSLGHASPAARRTLVAGAFRVRRPALVAGSHVLVVDDVMTTGATLAECARVLLAAGASDVSVAALARAV
jgi:ComF family protein